MNDLNVDVKEVNFENVSMIACKTPEDKILVGIRSVCDGLGVDNSSQFKRIQRDEVLSTCVVKMTIELSGQNRELSFLEVEALPLFLTGITSSICKESVRPKLKEFKLKAKDVLAQAFIKPLSKELQAIFMLDSKQQELESKITKVEDELMDVKENSPLYTIECKELQSLVKKIGTKVLGGYRSPAYNNKSLRSRVYSDIQQQLKREFGVARYEAIKRSKLEVARKIVEEYKAPIVLTDEIYTTNRQIVIEA